jgi:hypothetical protein
MSDIAVMLARSNAVVLLAKRQAVVRATALQAETRGEAARLAAAVIELDNIDAAISGVAPASPSPPLGSQSTILKETEHAHAN